MISSQQKGECLDVATVKRLLNESLTAEEERIAESHLGDCANCQQQVEEFVSQTNSWIDFPNQLADMNGPSSRFDTFDEAPEDTTRDLKSMLGPTDDPQMLGRIGQYEICGVVGQGSTGIVFKALDPRLNRYVAIKALAAGYAHVGSSRQRFEREGRAIAAVRDPHVIEVYGVENFRGAPYIVMQYVPGGSLQQCVEREGPMSTEEVCRIGMQIAKGLKAAHRLGIVHRDIKPANILLEDGKQVAVVSDFGLARVADEASMTRTGTIAGTPQFMSPEQTRGAALDARSDLFSLGSTMYTLCTGQAPFRGETLMGVVHRVCEDQQRPIQELNAQTAPWLAALIDKLLAKDPDSRFQSADEVAAILEEELAYLQSPTNMPLPDRDWWKKSKDKSALSGWLTRRGFGIVASLLILATIIVASFQFFGSSSSNSWGIEPTEQEQNYVRAKAAYDLAYETHLSEVSLRGDMSRSIQRHQEAMALGFDPAQSAYNLGRAHAIQGNADEAFQWLESAVKAGFHDREAMATERDFSRIRTDSRYTFLLNRTTALAKWYRTAQQVYFANRDYPAAEQRFRDLRSDCPNDEFSAMMIGASLLEQGKYAESKPWHEMTRRSVQYSKFGNYNLGCIAAQKRDFESAFSWLHHAVDLGFTDVEHLENDLQLITLRDLPEFKKLVKRMKEKNVTSR